MLNSVFKMARKNSVHFSLILFKIPKIVSRQRNHSSAEGLEEEFFIQMIPLKWKNKNDLEKIMQQIGLFWEIKSGRSVSVSEDHIRASSISPNEIERYLPESRLWRRSLRSAASTLFSTSSQCTNSSLPIVSVSSSASMTPLKRSFCLPTPRIKFSRFMPRPPF